MRLVGYLQVCPYPTYYILWETVECRSSTAGWATVSDTVVHISMNVVTGTVDTTIGPPSPPPPPLDGRCLHSLWLDWQLGKVRPRAAQELPILALHSSTLQRGIEVNTAVNWRERWNRSISLVNAGRGSPHAHEVKGTGEMESRAHIDKS